MLYFGSHVSISKGYLEAAKLADKIGAKSFQYFSKNPRSLSIKKVDPQDINECRRYSIKKGLVSIVHTTYPTNIAVDDDSLKEATVQSVLNDLEIAEGCDSVGVVVHFGKYKGKNLLAGYRNIIDILNKITAQWKGDALILLENQASGMGATFEELVQVRHLAQSPEKIGFCLDTCHLFASGVWNGENWGELLRKGTELSYFTHVKAVHLNDSMYPSGSLRDRHTNLGKGYIGYENIKNFMKSSFLQDIPIILETPQSSYTTHQEEIDFLYHQLQPNN